MLLKKIPFWHSAGQSQTFWVKVTKSLKWELINLYLMHYHTIEQLQYALIQKQSIFIVWKNHTGLAFSLLQAD